MTQFLFSLLTSAVTPLLAAWLGANFALRRFYSEKVWERKTAAYSSIFDALHDMRRWFDEHLRACEEADKSSDEAQNRLSADYQEAEGRLARQLDRERWLLPSICSERLVRMRRELDAADMSHDWIAHLDTGWRAINSTLEDVTSLARNDLKIDSLRWRNEVRSPAHEMNWRRGFFRVWAVVSLFFSVGIVILNYARIADVLHRGTAEPSDWSAEVRAGAGQITFTPDPVVPTPCDKARGKKGTDYYISAQACWYSMRTFRRLYPEYNDIDEGKLSDRLYDLVPGSRGDSQSPWIVLGEVAGVALGVPLGLLVAGISGAWALSGFGGGNPE